MCREDIRIMRRSHSTCRTKSVTTTSTQLVGYSTDRISLIISAPSAGTLWITTDTEAVVGAGFPLVAGDPPFRLNLLYDGESVTKTWLAIMSAGTISIGVIESFWKDDEQ